MFCKEQVAQLRDYVPRIHAAGGELVILGNGQPQHAAWFVEDYKVETPVFTDPELASHKILETKKQLWPDPRMLLATLRAHRAGNKQTKTMGSATQLGGVFVITADGEMPFRHVSAFAGDHPDPERVVGALEALAKAAR